MSEDAQSPIYEDDNLTLYKPIELEKAERVMMLAALEKAKGDKIAAANSLGIGKSTFYRRLKEYEKEYGKEISDSIERGFVEREDYTPPGDYGIVIRDIVDIGEFERILFLAAVRQASGDRTIAARRLGIGKSTLMRRLKEFSLKGDEEASMVLDSNVKDTQYHFSDFYKGYWDDITQDDEARFNGPLRLSRICFKYGHGNEPDNPEIADHLKRLWRGDHKPYATKTPDELFRDIVATNTRAIYPEPACSSEAFYTEAIFAPIDHEKTPDSPVRSHAVDELAYRFEKGDKEWVQDLLDHEIRGFGEEGKALVEFIAARNLKNTGDRKDMKEERQDGRAD